MERQSKNRKINWERGLTRTLGMIFIAFLFIYCIGLVGDEVNANKDREVLEVVVEKGDTLWSLASKHHDQKTDIRKTIFQIKELNQIGDTIYPGQVLYIPAP